MWRDYLIKLVHLALPKQALTCFAGWLAEVRIPWIKHYLIRDFIARYHVNMDEARETDLKAYPTFNAFFIRALKPGVRPIADADIVSPVDGYVSEFGTIRHGELVQAKQRTYLLHELLSSSPPQCEAFDGGTFITLYLSPADYHRVHMPVQAVLQSMVYVPGALFSVQPATTRVIPRLFAQNERVIVFFETLHGPMAMVLVGATIVGSIATTWHGPLKRTKWRQTFDYTMDAMLSVPYAKAAEMGYFKLGSTVILLFSKQAKLHWDAGIQVGQPIRYGNALAQVTSV